MPLTLALSTLFLMRVVQSTYRRGSGVHVAEGDEYGNNARAVLLEGRYVCVAGMELYDPT